MKHTCHAVGGQELAHTEETSMNTAIPVNQKAVSADLVKNAWFGEQSRNRLARLVAREDRLVQAARTSITKFVTYVMREMTSREEIECLAHQKVALDFVMHHDRAVLMLPIGHSKTFCMAAVTLFLLGQDPTLRGAVVSATQEQAKKVIAVVADYIMHSAALHRVFPELRKSQRSRDPWTQTAITVIRPPGIPDASLFAVGIDGGLPGARLNWIIVDDILNRENTSTNEARAKVYEFFDSTVLNRLDPKGARVVVTNTTWHPDDLVHKLEKYGWPTLRMDIMGDVRVQDDVEWIKQGKPQWEHPELRPKSRSPHEDCYRLRSNDPDPNNEKTLWNEKYPREVIDTKIRPIHLAVEFNRAYMLLCRDDATSMCRREDIELCKRIAREKGVFSMTEKYTGDNPTFTGLDLAVSPGEEADDTAFFTFEVLPDGVRRILDIEYGKWSGPVILDKLFAKERNYKSVIRVESNACLIPGTNVLTMERGYVPIEEVGIGEHVWTHRARWRSVMGRAEGWAEKITRFKARGSVGFSATPNHWFWMREVGRLPGRSGGHHRPVGDATWVSIAFAERPAYVAVAIPRWEPQEASFAVEPTRKLPGKTFLVDEDFALLLGLYLAEGHATGAQVFWTLSRRERHIADFLVGVLHEKLPFVWTIIREGSSTLRVVANSKGLAKAFRAFGKSNAKTFPLEWLGWPVELRLAVVRGWLLGDGCLRENDGGSSRFFSGSTISRNWLLWLRTTLLGAGLRAVVSREASRTTSVIEGRIVNRRPIYTLRIPADDSAALRAAMTSDVEAAHWPTVRFSGCDRKSGGAAILDGDHAWSRVQRGPATWEEYGGPVYNLQVEEDESYTAEDVIVHNAQDYIRQFALQKDKSIPVKAHMTGRAKAHPEHGVPGIFLEMSNGAWLIPNDEHGNVHPSVQRFIDGCLYYTPSKHTDDVLMAAYLAREQAKSWGMLLPPPKNGAAKGSLQMNLTSR